MRYFTLIKNNKINIDELSDMLKSLVGQNLIVTSINDKFILEYSFDNQDDVKALIEAYFIESMCDGIIYTSYSDEKKYEKEKELAIKIADYLPVGTFNIHDLALYAQDANLSSAVLDFILESSGVSREFIEGFCENNLNVLQASKAMYVHRNTMNYKLDKLKQTSDFDLRSFKDAYALYSLILKK